MCVLSSPPAAALTACLWELTSLSRSSLPPPPPPPISSVQLPFYQKFGFTVAGRVENYYSKRIENPHAVHLKKAVNGGAAS